MTTVGLELKPDSDMKGSLIGEIEGAFGAEVVDLRVHVFGKDVRGVDAPFDVEGFFHFGGEPVENERHACDDVKAKGSAVSLFSVVRFGNGVGSVFDPPEGVVKSGLDVEGKRDLKTVPEIVEAIDEREPQRQPMELGVVDGFFAGIGLEAFAADVAVAQVKAESEASYAAPELPVVFAFDNEPGVSPEMLFEGVAEVVRGIGAGFEFGHHVDGGIGVRGVGGQHGAGSQRGGNEGGDFMKNLFFGRATFSDDQECDAAGDECKQ